MRRSQLLIVAGLWLASMLGLILARGSQGLADEGKSSSAKPKATKPVPKPTEGTCGNYGTRVDFVNTPSEAARQAKKEEKLVFVLHVSGHFEDPRFT